MTIESQEPQVPGVDDPGWLASLKQWARGVVRDLRALWLTGDGKTVKVSHGSGGTSISIPFGDGSVDNPILPKTLRAWYDSAESEWVVDIDMWHQRLLGIRHDQHRLRFTLTTNSSIMFGFLKMGSPSHASLLRWFVYDGDVVGADAATLALEGPAWDEDDDLYLRINTYVILRADTTVAITGYGDWKPTGYVQELDPWQIANVRLVNTTETQVYVVIGDTAIGWPVTLSTGANNIYVGGTYAAPGTRVVATSNAAMDFWWGVAQITVTDGKISAITSYTNQDAWRGASESVPVHLIADAATHVADIGNTTRDIVESIDGPGWVLEAGGSGLDVVTDVNVDGDGHVTSVSKATLNSRAINTGTITPRAIERVGAVFSYGAYVGYSTTTTTTTT